MFLKAPSKSKVLISLQASGNKEIRSEHWFWLRFGWIFAPLTRTNPSYTPFLAVNWFGCSRGSDGPHDATNHSWHGVQVMDATRVLDLQVLLHERLN